MAKINKTMFRTYDIRGVVEKDLTVASVALIGQALGTYAKRQGQDTVVTARDGRLSGPVLLAALQAGIERSGCRVIDLGAAPTPVLYYATYALGKPTGAMLTGSHNPPDYNGIKMVVDGKALSGESIQALYALIENDDLEDVLSSDSADPLFPRQQVNDILSQYVDRITSDITLKKPLKIVIDCGNGIAGCVATKLYEALGCEVIELFCEVDGNFPNHHPDPSQVDNLQDLMAAIKATKADIGLAFDGDADRLGVVTASGQVIWPDRQLILFAKDILSRHPGAEIVYDVKCTRYVPEIVSKLGGKPLICATGHSLVKAKLRETGALLAGEFSGHMFFKERWYGFDDALYTGARLLEILAGSAADADGLFADIPESVNTPEIKIAIDDEEKFIFIEKLIQQASFEGGEVNTLDGLRVDFENGFGLVRCSNTTPCLVCRFEADDSVTLANIQADFKAKMLAVSPDLSVPF